MDCFRRYKGYEMTPSAPRLGNGLFAADLVLESHRGPYTDVERFEALDYFFEAEQAVAYALRWGKLWIDARHKLKAA
jgi:hypothetical protein